VLYEEMFQVQFRSINRIPFTGHKPQKNSFSIKPTDALISKFILVTQIYRFWAASLPIIRSYLLTIGTGTFYAGFDDLSLA